MLQVESRTEKQEIKEKRHRKLSVEMPCSAVRNVVEGKSLSGSD